MKKKRQKRLLKSLQKVQKRKAVTLVKAGARTIRMAGKQGELRALSRPELDVLFPPRQGMHNPAHPGQILKCLCLEPLGLTVSTAADHLQVSRVALSGFIKGRRAITPDLAMRIELLFSSRAELWLGIQAKYDAWQAEAARSELSRVIKPIKRESKDKEKGVKPAEVKRGKEKSVLTTSAKVKALGKKK